MNDQFISYLILFKINNGSVNNFWIIRVTEHTVYKSVMYKFTILCTVIVNKIFK